jgi:heptosyltransferase-2
VPRFLIAKIAAMGDVIMASAMLPAIHSACPDAHVTWLTDKALAPLVRRFEGVGEIIAIPAGKLLTGNAWDRAVSLANCWKSLGLRRWDRGIVAHADPRYRLLMAGARITSLTVQPAVRSAERPLPWMGAQYTALIGEAAGNTPATLARLIPSHGKATQPARPGIVLAPGGARNVLRDDPLRRWPLAHWRQLATELTRSGYTVTLVGGANDTHDAAAVAAAAPGVVNLAGRTSLEELLALIEYAPLVVTHDSGTLHLAALTRTPAVALFGPTVAAERIPPGAPIAVATAAASLPCAPCYDGRNYAPCAHNRCLADVPVDTVLRLIERQLRPEPTRFGMEPVA